MRISETPLRDTDRHRRFVLAVAFVMCALPCVSGTHAWAQGTGGESSAKLTSGLTADSQSLQVSEALQPVIADGPRETLAAFVRLTNEFEEALIAYRQNETRHNSNRLVQLGAQFFELIDLSLVPQASRRDVGEDVTAYLMDILGRIELPAMASVPDADDDLVSWRIPSTPIKIVRIGDGPRAGEFLFGNRTAEVAPRFFERIRHLPLRTTIGIESWVATIPHLTGPMVPSTLLSFIPDILQFSWLGTPIWKAIFVVMLSIFAGSLLIFWNRYVSSRSLSNKILDLLLRGLGPTATIFVVAILAKFVNVELNVGGTFSTLFDSFVTMVIYVALVWAFWLVVKLVFEWIILSPRIPDVSLDADLLRLSAHIIGVIGAVLILARGLQDLGLPVLSLLTGLGLGGLAVALAIRPTFENLIGGVILFSDRPVSVGDFCSFGDLAGTVEKIGMRSTQVRAPDRSLISIPNSKFADMEIINWAQCDKMMILTTIGLRYETRPDQLRFALVKLREMFYAHPKIDPENVRVRFSGYGASSLDIAIRVYALTRDWDEFHAIREDVYLRVSDIISDSGSGFAFPSQTLYMARDNGIDEQRGETAIKSVMSWREAGQLPFPGLNASDFKELENTLDYPPRGSPEALSTSPETDSTATERVGASPVLDEAQETEGRERT